MPKKLDDSTSKLSAFIPREIHKQAKILATARDINLQDLVAKALQDYLTDSGLSGAAGRLGIASGIDPTVDGEHSNG